MTLRHFGFIIIGLIFSVVAHAATDDVIISQQITGVDNTPPSIPGNFSATPVSLSQINLAWSTSSDNVLVSGYQVFRDGAQIATATAVTYSDTGLTPSTTYTYYVTAFDSSGNISASSTEVATTTLASSTPPTPTPTTTPATGGAGERIELTVPPIALVSLEVIPGRDFAVIRYTTEGFVRAVVRWGETPSYELGSAAEQRFSKTHETRIVDLRPGTTYHYSIEGENHVGHFGYITTGTFQTLAPEDIFPPANISDFRATVDGTDILLSWANPRDEDFDRVRILRSDRFFPIDTADGSLVYEGGGESVLDPGVALPGTILYYTAFSYDALGNISSGATLAVRIGADGTSEPVPIDEIVDPTVNPIALEFSDLIFTQDGVPLRNDDGEVAIDGTKQLSIALPYNKVPEHLKTILVSLEDRRDSTKVFTFLLRINTTRDAYEAHLAPLGIAGRFPVTIALFDYETAQIGYASGIVVSTIARAPLSEDTGFLTALFKFTARLTEGYIVWFLIFLAAILFIARWLLRASW